MTEGLSSDLVLAAITVGIAGFIVLCRYLPVTTSLVISAVKVSIPLIYFGFFYDGSWSFLDDEAYQLHGELLRRLDYNPISVLVEEAGRAKLVELSAGQHVLYAWWNLLAQSLFGEHYYAAVFLNVLLTFVIGAVFFHLIQRLMFGHSYQRGLLVFFLVHWDLLAWSSLLNLKDILVMGFIVAGMYFFVRLHGRWHLMAAAGAVFTLFCLMWLRFYVPLVMLMAYVVWLTLESGRAWKYVYAFLIAGTFLLLPIDWSALEYIEVSSLPTGLLRAPLTPQPWSVEEEYSFLVIPAMLHWLFFVPLLFGASMLWARSGGARLAIVFLVLMLLLYAAVPGLQGPRHRVQLTFLVAWMQFHFFWQLTALVVQRRMRLGSG